MVYTFVNENIHYYSFIYVEQWSTWRPSAAEPLMPASWFRKNMPSNTFGS